MSRSIRSAVTVSLVPAARGGPFVFWDDLPAACAAASGLGFEGIEIFAPHADDLDGLGLRELFRTHSLSPAAFGTGAGWVTRKLSLTDPDAHTRMCARDFIGSFIDLAGGFGAPAIIGSMQGRWGPGASREQALAWLKEELDQLGPRAHALEVPLLLEPLNRYESNLFNTLDETVAFLETLRTRNVKILADLFHLGIEEADPAGAIRRHASHIGHVHFADSNRRAAGLGHTDFGPIANALKESGYSGFVSAEVLPLPSGEEAAAQTIQSFRRYFR